MLGHTVALLPLPRNSTNLWVSSTLSPLLSIQQPSGRSYWTPPSRNVHYLDIGEQVISGHSTPAIVASRLTRVVHVSQVCNRPLIGLLHIPNHSPTMPLVAFLNRKHTPFHCWHHNGLHELLIGVYGDSKGMRCTVSKKLSHKRSNFTCQANCCSNNKGKPVGNQYNKAR